VKHLLLVVHSPLYGTGLKHDEICKNIGNDVYIPLVRDKINSLKVLVDKTYVHGTLETRAPKTGRFRESSTQVEISFEDDP
jgi:hypothetical protein